jgi:hypothetical protein
MEYYVEAGPKTKKFIESLLPSMLEQLKLTRSRQLLHIIVDRDIEHLAETIPLPGIGTVLVVLKPTRRLSELGITLAHELTHVAQFAKGTLQVTPKGKRWKGKFYGNDVAYLQQPWEIDAFSKQELIFRRAIE